MRQWSNNLQVRVGVGQVILIREIPSIVVSALIGGAIGVVSGFVDFAISQVTGGQKFNLNGALGAAANGAVVGVARGALAGTGVGIPLAFATDFVAGTLGSALEQCISEGKGKREKERYQRPDQCGQQHVLRNRHDEKPQGSVRERIRSRSGHIGNQLYLGCHRQQAGPAVQIKGGHGRGHGRTECSRLRDVPKPQKQLRQ